MGSTKASLILYFLFLLHLQLHHFIQASSSSTTRLATVDPSHVNLPDLSVESRHDSDAFADKTAELAVVVKKGGGGHGGGGHGGGGHGGGGHSFGGRGRCFGGGEHGGGEHGGGEHGGGIGERSIGGRGIMNPGFGGGGGGSHHGGKVSSSDRKSVSVWLGLSTLLGLVLYF